MDLFLQIESHIEQSMSDFQIENFVVNDHITPYRKIKQIVIEIRTRMENKASAMLDEEETKIKIEQAQHELKSDTPGSFNTRLREVEIQRLQFQLNRKQHQIALIDREIAVFDKSLAEISAQLGGDAAVIEKIASKEFRDAGEAEYWERRLSRNVLADLLSTGTIGKGVFETLTTLPDGTVTRIIGNAVAQNTQIHLSLDKMRDDHLIAVN
jgi:hypothetical protein